MTEQEFKKHYLTLRALIFGVTMMMKGAVSDSEVELLSQILIEASERLDDATAELRYEKPKLTLAECMP